MNSNEDKLYIQIVEIDVIYTFVVDKIFDLESFKVPKIHV